MNTASKSMLLATVVAGALVGCGGRTDGIYHVTGTITFNGQPVPSGVIYFDPDTAKGNRGQQGSALIRDGKFDTAAEYGRGIAGGAQRIRISGFDGQNINETQLYGNRLFPDYNEVKEMPLEDCKLDFAINLDP